MIGAIVAGGLSAPTAPVTNSYESIASSIVGSGGTPYIDFTSIPSTYKHLQLRCVAKDGRTGIWISDILIRFNSDSGSNYSQHKLWGDGSSPGADGQGNTTEIAWSGFFGTADYSNFGAGILDVLDYANTNKYKTVRGLAGVDQNGSGRVGLQSGNWRSTSAVTSMRLIPLVGNFAQYSSFALYGIKG